MKARESFVSNSSSASYIIKIKNHNCAWMYETISDLLGFELENEIYEEAEKDIAWLENQIEMHEKEVKTKSYKPDRLFVDEYPERIKVLEGILDERKTTMAVGRPDDWRKHLETLGRHAVIIRKLDVSESHEGVKIEGHTSMHNAFTDGMPAIMQEISLAIAYGELDVEAELTIERQG